MAKGQLSSWLKLLSVGAFAGLLIIAFGAGCNGFFVNPTLCTLAIQPPTPSVEVGSNLALQAWGNYSDGSRSQLTSGVAWTSSEPSVIAVGSNSGNMSAPANSTGGTATITAAAQGISATADATSYLGNITNFQVCEGTFNTGTCPVTNWDMSAAAGGTQDFYVVGTANNTVYDLTTATTWTLSSNDSGAITCTNSSSPGSCAVTASTTTTPTGQGTFTVTITYGTSNSTSFTITIGP